jgi:hypothetical protein
MQKNISIPASHILLIFVSDLSHKSSGTGDEDAAALVEVGDVAAPGGRHGGGPSSGGSCSNLGGRHAEIHL